jgi:hypothetical protein
VETADRLGKEAQRDTTKHGVCRFRGSPQLGPRPRATRASAKLEGSTQDGVERVDCLFPELQPVAAGTEHKAHFLVSLVRWRSPLLSVSARCEP